MVPRYITLHGLAAVSALALCFFITSEAAACCGGGGGGGGGGGRDRERGSIFDNIRNRGFDQWRPRQRRVRPVRGPRRVKPTRRRPVVRRTPRPQIPPGFFDTPPPPPNLGARPPAPPGLFDTPRPPANLGARPPVRGPSLSVNTPFTLPPKPGGNTTPSPSALSTLTDAANEVSGSLTEGIPAAVQSAPALQNIRPGLGMGARNVNRLVNAVRSGTPRLQGGVNLNRPGTGWGVRGLTRFGNALTVANLVYASRGMAFANNAQEYGQGVSDYARTAAGSFGALGGAAAVAAAGGALIAAPSIGAVAVLAVAATATASLGSYISKTLYDATISTGVKNAGIGYYNAVGRFKRGLSK